MRYHKNMSSEQLQRTVERLPRVKFAHLPTPLEECSRLAIALSPQIAVPTVFVKRDDLTGLGIGGNKARHLEFHLGDALSKNCDTFVCADNSNEGRLSAAACAKVGMKFIQVFPGPTHQANLSLSRLFGADLHYVQPGDDPLAKAYEEAEVIMKELTKKGRNPYRVQSTPWYDQSGVVSYLLAALELQAQFQERNIRKAAIFMVAGHSQVGLQLAVWLLGLQWRVIGIAHAFESERPRPSIDWARQVVNLLELPIDLSQHEINVVYDYAAPGFHKPSKVSQNAVKVVGQTEGIALDPVYTGKAMAALIDHVTSGSASPDTAVVFIHTGGLPILFDNIRLFEPE